MRWKRKIKYYTVRLLRVKQGSHQVALGFVLGFFPCWFPTFGIGPALSLGLTKLMRGNLPSAIVAASLGSVAWPFLFYANYKIGNLFRSLSTVASIDKIDELLMETVPESDYTETVNRLNRLGDMGMNFLLGSLFNSVLFSIIAYAAFRFILSRYRHHILHALRCSK
jgi:uncharacterized protein (DUF2062 family)